MIQPISFTGTVGSATQSFTAGPSATETPTRSESTTPTTSGTATPTFTQSPTPTGTLTRSPTPTLSASPSVTPFYSATGTLTATPTRSPSPTHTVTPTRTDSRTPGGASTGGNNGPPELLRVLPVPNPQGGPFLSVAFQLSAAADVVELKIYSVALAMVHQVTLKGPFAPGWDSAVAPAPGLSRGLYYMKLTAKRSGTTGGPSQAAKLLWIP